MAIEAGKLYDKMFNFIEDLKKVGEQLERSQLSYNNCMAKLKDGKGNILGRFNTIKNLGAKTQKTIKSQEYDHMEKSDSEIIN